MDTTNELLMRNRGYQPRVQLPFPPLDLIIGHVRSRGRQYVKEFSGQRGALTTASDKVGDKDSNLKL